MAYVGENQVLFGAEITGLVNIDDEMSAESENPVQNKVLKAYIDKLTETIKDKTLLTSENMDEHSLSLVDDITIPTTLAVAILIELFAASATFGTDNIRNLAITTAKLAAKAVTFQKIDFATSTISENPSTLKVPTEKAVYEYVEGLAALVGGAE